MLLQPKYPLRLLDDGSLLLYAYDDTTCSIWFGLFFYSYFLPLWAASFLGPIGFIYLILTKQYVWLQICYSLLIIWLYWPRQNSLRIIPYLQLAWFFELPKYFRDSSFRVLEPAQHPQLAKVMELFKEVGFKSSSSFPKHSPFAAHRYKEIALTPRAIIALTAYDPLKKWPCDIFCCFPHGLTSNGWGQLSFCPFFNDVWNCISSVLYYFGHGIVAHSACLGNPHPATATAIKQTLAEHRAISIVAGGFEEATMMTYKTDRIYLKQRWGIFKLAAQNRAGLIPYFAFGENHSFMNVQGFEGVRRWLNRYSIPGTLCLGQFMWLPYRTMLHVVMGKRIIPADSESVESLKNRFTTDLSALHLKYGKLYYKEEYKPLEIL